MILADTSIWISYFRKDDKDIAEILKSYIKTEEIVTVSVVIGELLQGVKNQRERNMIEILRESLPRPDESGLFKDAGDISNQYNLNSKGVGLIDCYILSACLRGQHALWTLDKKLGEAFDEIAG